jgi:glycosyltransferase involved in cell wall biosynthesis
VSRPLVTVVVPTLNAARFLRDALDSVAAQTYDAWEVVLVDGGSSDATVAIAKRYERVRITAQRGRGLADAWNCGIDAARGELIAFLDSDDRWEPGKLARQVHVLAADPGVDCVIARMQFVLEAGLSPPPGFKPELLASDHLAYMPSALLARRTVFERVGTFDTRWTIAADADWFARLKDAAVHIEVVPAVLVHKRVHEANLSTLGRATLNRELVELLRESVERQRRAQ